MTTKDQQLDSVGQVIVDLTATVLGTGGKYDSNPFQDRLEAIINQRETEAGIEELEQIRLYKLSGTDIVKRLAQLRGDKDAS